MIRRAAFPMFVVVVVFGTSIWVQAALGHARDRQVRASSWSGPDAQFSTEGGLNQTLFIALPDAGQDRCAVMLDSVNADGKLVSELRAVGFNSMKCGTQVENIR